MFLSLVHTWLPDRIGFAKKASSSRTTWQTVGQQDLKIPSSYHILSRCCHLFQTLVWQTVRVPEAPGNFKVVTGQSQLFENCEIGTHFLVSIFFFFFYVRTALLISRFLTPALFSIALQPTLFDKHLILTPMLVSIPIWMRLIRRKYITPSSPRNGFITRIINLRGKYFSSGASFLSFQIPLLCQLSGLSAL